MDCVNKCRRFCGYFIRTFPLFDRIFKYYENIIISHSVSFNKSCSLSNIAREGNAQYIQYACVSNPLSQLFEIELVPYSLSSSVILSNRTQTQVLPLHMTEDRYALKCLRKDHMFQQRGTATSGRSNLDYYENICTLYIVIIIGF